MQKNDDQAVDSQTGLQYKPYSVGYVNLVPLILLEALYEPINGPAALGNVE